MFYNLQPIYRNMFIYSLSKITYDTIYKSRDSSSKIITILMCIFGSKCLWDMFLIKKDNTIPLIDDMSDDKRVEDINNRSNIDDVINDVDRLIGSSKILNGENIDTHIV